MPEIAKPIDYQTAVGADDELWRFSVSQVAFFLSYAVLVVFWVLDCSAALAYRYAHSVQPAKPKQHEHIEDQPVSGEQMEEAEPKHQFRSLVSKVFGMPQQQAEQWESNMAAMVEFGAWMCWYYLCDRTKFFSHSFKNYNRDLFAFICLSIVLVASRFTKTGKTPTFLNREQTEEWKGWMQVLFLLYHYFEAKEVYNGVRLCIASYVWMTGFGNFHYYFKTNDFSVMRLCQMLWRINFLVFFVCIVMGNSYMLYYICPMHTFYTLLVYACLGIGWQFNKSPAFMWFKFAMCFVFIIIFWDIKEVFDFIWSPFTWLMGYRDPRATGVVDPLHEWHFRGGLDKYVWIFGMIFAYLQPMVTSGLQKIDEQQFWYKWVLRGAVVVLCLSIGTPWYHTVYVLPKHEYNKIHPYTSWIPITLWIILRNLSPELRSVHLTMFAWLGRITLETYLSQFHIWLGTMVKDGQPKLLLDFLSPSYPLLNFMLATAIYIYASNRLFTLTHTLKDIVIDKESIQLTLQRLGVAVMTGSIMYVAALWWLSI